VSRGVFLDRAGAADVSALAALEATCFSHPWTAAQIAAEIVGEAPGTVLVLRAPPSGADPARGIRAYCTYRVVLDEMHILDLAVDPACRRLGLARWLVRFAMKRAARAGARLALLEVRAGNRAALALYDALGFVPRGVRRDYYREPAEDAVVLERRGLGGPIRNLEVGR
jgi:ribosomal-protein-alanine N-acetyltransferase